ncbi:MAG: rhodanese-like domain-containing protein [Armatimonadetes bacterium]|nr:rhodanese-like domain-containing protein [Armatimonadota bacterium]NIM23543.1 rhodanese-like domain-containing protein [Armatimonadota bacterium]NIM67409.1 rhodanese-like domain-containing protein [Armatimonadota bacterium]NIM75910.1 rhodanese-like domain-containing protein [Armatimonadota bacterium]NIN05595.1 rhodanese-like domain-containing protein [Armatimonadota bacterium]
MQTITKEALKEKLERGDNLVVVYVLSPESFMKARIKGSINIPLEDLKEQAPTVLPDKDKEIIVYCANFECTASPSAGKALEEMGYTNIVDYEGGIKDWIEAGYPTESGPPKISED